MLASSQVISLDVSFLTCTNRYIFDIFNKKNKLMSTRRFLFGGGFAQRAFAPATSLVRRMISREKMIIRILSLKEQNHQEIIARTMVMPVVKDPSKVAVADQRVVKQVHLKTICITISAFLVPSSSLGPGRPSAGRA